MSKQLIKVNIDSLFAAIFGFVLILLFSKHNGIGISPDSIAYSATARNLIAGNGFIDYTNMPLVAFPLFYPFFLAVIGFVFNTDIIQLAPFLNAFLFASVIFLSGMVIEYFKYKTKLYKRVLLILITLSPSLIEVYTMLWSETLFILLSLLFFYFFRQYFQNHNLKSLSIAAIISALAFDTRYAGITLIATGVLLIFFDKYIRWQLKALHVVYFGSIGVSLATINLIRNVWVVGLATGMRQKGVTPLMKNFEYSGNVLTDWFSLDIHNQLFLKIIFFLVLILFVAFFVRNVRHWKAFYTYENIAVSFFIVYVLFIVISSTISRYETINNRLLAPAFLPFLFISTCQLPKWRKSLSQRHLSWIFLGFTLGIGILFAISYLSVNEENLEYMQETGIPGYSEDTWEKSRIVNYLQKHPEIFDNDSIIYSNHSQAVYFLTGNQTISLPERVYHIDVQDFERHPSALLIWFNMDDNPDLLNLKEIRRMKQMKRLKTFPDGAIYKLTNR